MNDSGQGKMRIVPEKQIPKAKKRRRHPATLISAPPLYATDLGAAYTGDALDLLKLLPSRTIDAIITSPPYALHFKKSYGNPGQAEYVDWFMTFADEFRRVLRPNGSLVIEIGGAWNRGEPTRSIYHFELLVKLVKEAGFHLAEEFFCSARYGSRSLRFPHISARLLAYLTRLMSPTDLPPNATPSTGRLCRIRNDSTASPGIVHKDKINPMLQTEIED